MMDIPSQVVGATAAGCRIPEYANLKYVLIRLNSYRIVIVGFLARETNMTVY